MKCVSSKNENKSCLSVFAPLIACRGNDVESDAELKKLLQSKTLFGKKFFAPCFRSAQRAKHLKPIWFLVQVCFHLSTRHCDTVSWFVDLRDLFFSCFNRLARNQIF